MAGQGTPDAARLADAATAMVPRVHGAVNRLATECAVYNGRAMLRFLLRLHFLLTAPIAIGFILSSKRIHPSYRMSFVRRYALGLKMFINSVRIPTGTSFKAHLAMALKILETPPDVQGAIVECGAWKGGSSTNLSLVCRIVGRKLKIFDSFQGLPAGKSGDREALHYRAGDYGGTLAEVRRNLARYGALDVCEFVPGWFHDTLPHLNEPVLLAFLDVDLEDSLATCVRYVWPRLVDGGYLFTDECVGTDYVALFYSEKWWWTHFNRTPPGLIGAGTGLALGEYYIGPWSERDDHPLQHASTGAYTRTSMSGYWSYYPEET
jgi:O-methyltransferase